MAKFKQVPQSFLLNKLLTYWGNMVQNYRSNVTDDDFFDIIRNCFDHDKAVELIEAAFTSKEINEMQKSSSRRNRLDLTDPLDDIFQCLWNNERAREKCRVVLESIKDYMLADNPVKGVEPLEKRFKDIKRLMKLTDLESEILILAYVKSQTCFDWPCRIDDREKPLYYAMALDRSYGEVAKVMTAKGRLRKFDLLDNDWDFNCRAIGGYIDGTEADALERRFYKKCEDEEVLPWEFYGDLSSKDGEIIKQMLSAGKGKCNILFYGQPGTGKTEFVKYLGKVLDRKVLVMKGSDILSKWVGGTEENIAAAFSRAEAEHAILFFDEIDGLVQERENAHASWEVSQVNELLQQMEDFDGVMIAATNFRKNLDPAIVRRFTFKLEFDYLDDDGKRIFFEKMFKTELTDEEFAELSTIQNLTPGDFRTVRQEQFYLADEQTNLDRIAALKEECALKKDGNKTNRIGFSA